MENLSMPVQILITVLLAPVAFWLLAQSLEWLKKAFVTQNVTISRNTGDAEGVVFNANFYVFQSAKSKRRVMEELFWLTQERKDATHAAWLRIKAESEAEKKKSKGA